MAIVPAEEFARLRQSYQDDERQSSFNVLLLGESGAGKTFMLRTARKPVHIDSFDPGGTKGLRPWIDKGEVLVDTSYEGESPTKPFAYNKWKKDFQERVSSGYFSHIGTYVIDSATSWGEAIMNSILKKANLAGKAPRFTHDYVPQKIEIRNMLRECLDLPCSFILTGHHEIMEDVDGEGRKALRFKFMTTGKGTVTIPLLFDEIYSIVSTKSSGGVNRALVTQNDGIHTARSRLSKDGKFKVREDPDFKKLLQKAGEPFSDKPLTPEEGGDNKEKKDDTA